MLIKTNSGSFHNRQKKILENFFRILQLGTQKITVSALTSVILDEFDYGGSASINMRIINHWMRWSILAFLDSHTDRQTDRHTRRHTQAMTVPEGQNLTRINKANQRDLIAVTGLVISNWIQSVNFSARVTVKFDGWPRKTIGHFYTTSSFVHHFKSIGEFKLDLQSRNAQLGSKLVICYPVWPWNLMDDLGKQ